MIIIKIKISPPTHKPSIQVAFTPIQTFILKTYTLTQLESYSNLLHQKIMNVTFIIAIFLPKDPPTGRKVALNSPTSY